MIFLIANLALITPLKNYPCVCHRACHTRQVTHQHKVPAWCEPQVGELC